MRKTEKYIQDEAIRNFKMKLLQKEYFWLNKKEK